MNIAERCRLHSAREAIIEDLKPKYIMPYLIEQNIITEQEEQILSLGSPEQQAEKLLDMLPQKSSEVFKKFIKVLKAEDECGVNYPWLADKLIQTTYDDLNGETRSNVHERSRELLTNGGVPFQTNCLLPRKNKIENIRNKLRHASEEVKKTFGRRHWVVLHGMTGTGKSVLAAEALRDNELIESCFSDGVYWISVGNLKDENALGLKMKKLFKFMNCEEKYVSSPEDLHELTYELKKIVLSKDILVVLDDVWDHKAINVIDFFDIGCTILVTTKFSGIVENYSKYSSLISCTNDFQIEEGKELLAMFVDCRSDELPIEAERICRKCKGSPFTLSHIGRWMARYGNKVECWQSLWRKIEGGTQKALRHKNSSGDELKEIKNVIHLTLDPISEYADFYLDFVIFPEDVWVPSQVFEVLWSKDGSDVQDTMYYLLRASLVQYEKDPLNCYSYGIHDLYLEILREICRDSTSDRHQKLVNNYLKLCKTSDGEYDFSLLPNDEYIHYYIGYHMEQAREQKIVDDITLDDIYFDLRFIETKIQLDTRDLLVDYQNYRHLFKDEKSLEVFKSFASKVISKKKTVNKEDCDIIQWGLFELTDSIVYKKALKLASKSYDKSYFKWCNQEENQSHMTNLNSKLMPFENIRHAAISADGQLIACVGNEHKVKIFSCATGDELLELSGHSKAVNYCVFNSTRSKLATASNDRSVRVFEIDIPFALDMKPAKKRSHPEINFGSDDARSPDMSLLAFQQHFSPVLCCNFSPDEYLIVSSDSSGFANVWQSSEGDLKFAVNHNAGKSLYPTNYCGFNSDGTLLGTAAYDSIKLWSTEDGTFLKKLLHNEMSVRGFCFTHSHMISVANNNIYKHCIQDGKQDVIPLHKNLLITSCGLSSNDNYLACGTSESTVVVYNINSGRKISNFKGHKNAVLNVMYAQNGKRLLSVSEDGYIPHDIVDVRDVSLVDFEGNLSVRQKSNDLIIACSNSCNCIEIRKGISGQLYCKTDPDESDITACSLSNDCTEVVYGTKTGNVKVYNIQNNTIEVLPKHDEQINYITHSKNDWFFTCSEDKTIKMWKNKKPDILRGHTQSVLMCLPFKKCNKLLSCSKDGTLRVWDVDKGKMILSTEGHGNQDVRFCDLSFDEKLMASASADCTVKIWFTENGTLHKTLVCESEVRCCRFSPSFQVLVSGCDCGQVVRWQLGFKAEPKISNGHVNCAFNIYFNQDGSQYLSIADDIKIWERGKNDPQTLLLPSSYMGVARPCIWASDSFDTFVVIHGSVLYILRKIVTSNGNSCH